MLKRERERERYPNANTYLAMSGSIDPLPTQPFLIGVPEK